MRGRSIFATVSLVIAALGLAMLTAVPWTFADGYRDTLPLALCGLTTTLVGAGLVWILGPPEEIQPREGFAIVTFSWIAAGIVGALPYLLTGAVPSFTDALFESLSGFTTTGATILGDIESLGRGLLFWRSMTHWLGGMGIIVLSLALLPLVGVGGMELFKAEVTGPEPDKLTPRVADTARILWLVYVGLSALQVLLYLAGGLNLFDALTHSFGTLATGGFSPRNASVGDFDSVYIEGVTILFMFLAGANFALHYQALTHLGAAPYRRDLEFAAYTALTVGAAGVVTLLLVAERDMAPGDALRSALFQVVSIFTTTGFATADYEAYPAAAQIILFLLMFVGGCAGSTAGGLKVMRVVLMNAQGGCELRRLVHPRGVFKVRLGSRVVPPRILQSIMTFVLLFFLSYALLTLGVALTGVDFTTSLAATIACLSSIGPGFGSVGPTETFAHLPVLAKWLLSFAMVLGRLELYTVLVLFLPTTWKSWR